MKAFGTLILANLGGLVAAGPSGAAVGVILWAIWMMNRSKKV